MKVYSNERRQKLKPLLNEVSIVGDQIYVGLGSDSNSTQIGYIDQL